MSPVGSFSAGSRVHNRLEVDAMDITLPARNEHPGHLGEDVAETALACGEILVRTAASLAREHSEMIHTVLKAAGMHIESVLQSASPQQPVSSGPRSIGDLAARMRQSAEEIVGIQRMAASELNLCLADGWKAMQSRRAGRSRTGEIV